MTEEQKLNIPTTADFPWLLKELAGALGPVYEPKEAQYLAKILLEELLGFSAAQLLAYGALELGNAETDQLNHWLAELQAGKPWQYVLGYAPFLDLKIPVQPGVLIPRPETEELVLMALRSTTSQTDEPLKVWDVCTGSACIALGWWHAREKQGVQDVVWATDWDPKALTIARQNITALAAPVKLVAHDALGKALPAGIPHGGLDLILSNPPYVLDLDRAEMHDRVLDHEPAVALFAPAGDALAFYRSIAQYGLQTLKVGGQLFLECHERYADEVAQLLQEAGYAAVQTHDDFRGRPRFVTGTWKPY